MYLYLKEQEDLQRLRHVVLQLNDRAAGDDADGHHLVRERGDCREVATTAAARSPHEVPVFWVKVR